MSSIPTYQSDLVAKTRKLLQGARNVPLSAIQRTTLTDPVVKGATWVSRDTFPAPEDGHDDLRGLLEHCIRALDEGDCHYTRPSIEDVDVRWTGYRPNVDEEEVEPPMSEQAKYGHLMEDTESPLTIMYFHGGGFTMGTPGRYHKVVAEFAKSTRGRCLSFRYRLAPQHPFPAALLDALVCYTSLIYPPPGAFHDPVSPSSIVFAGDSAGANLALALMQVLLFARSTSTMFHGRAVSLPLPSGIAVLSAGVELTLVLPSWKANAPYDIFSDSWSFLEPDYPACEIWPSDPPRGHPYCESSALLHPLVAPATATTWESAPPMWFAGGQERFADSAKLVAEVAARQGVKVWYEEYEEMPHDFAIMSATWTFADTDQWPQSKRCKENWINACKAFVNGEPFATGAELLLTEGGKRSMNVKKLTSLTFEEALSLARERQKSWKAFVK